jgi:hypothetical protein
VTDDQGDFAGVNLAGVGDEYELALANGQLEEETVIVGNPTTFKAQVNPDNVFGMNGERVTFVCPDNLPHNSSCIITPCPAIVTVATAAPFQAVIGTSGNFFATARPPVGTPCASYSSAEIVTPGIRGPVLRMPPVPAPAWRGRRIPAPAVAAAMLAAVGLAMMLALGRAQSRQQRRAGKMRLAFVATEIVFAMIAGCGGKGVVLTPATPAGTTNMSVLGQALDANGNPINAQRSLKIILSVTTQ